LTDILLLTDGADFGFLLASHQGRSGDDSDKGEFCFHGFGFLRLLDRFDYCVSLFIQQSYDENDPKPTGSDCAAGFGG
jgi:hypothetical protein